MLVRLRDLRPLTGISGGYTHIKLPSPSSRSRRRPDRVKASKDKKKFNAQKKHAPAKASPTAGNLEADKKVAIVPPRIDSNSNIPVRRQQKFVKQKEAAEAAAKRPAAYKQTFRKAKIDPEQRAEEAKREAEYEAARRKNAKKSPLASLRNLYGTSGKEHPPIILVDGYNVLFKFVESLQLSHHSHPIAVAKTFDNRRQAFELSINAYSHARGVKAVIAYDAMNRPADPVYVDIRTSSRETLAGGVDVVFCSDQSADSWLVREVGNLQHEGKTPQIMVATDDNEVASSCSSRGSFPLPCRYLVEEILDAEKEAIEMSLSGLGRMDRAMRLRRGLHFAEETSRLAERFPALQALKMKKLAQEQSQRDLLPLESDRAGLSRAGLGRSGSLCLGAGGFCLTFIADL